MNDRVARYVVRGLVVATLLAAINGMIAARLVLSPGSGTTFGLFVFLPLLVVPGAIALRWPTPPVLGVWCGIGWVASVFWTLVANPYSYERQLAGWKYVAAPAYIALSIVIFIVPLVALVVAKPRPMPAELELFAARFRRVIVLALAITAFIVVLACAHAGGSGLVIGLVATPLVVPGMLAYRAPLPRWAWFWTAWCTPFAFFGVWIWAMLGPAVDWAARLAVGGIGTIFVLLLIGLPTITLATPRSVFTGSSARASYRSRSR